MAKQRVKKSEIVRELEVMKDQKIHEMYAYNREVLSKAYKDYIEDNYGSAIDEIITGIAPSLDKLLSLQSQFSKDEDLQTYAISSHDTFLQTLKSKETFIKYILDCKYSAGQFSVLSRKGQSNLNNLRDEWHKLITNVRSLTVTQAIKYLDELGIKLECIDKPKEETALMIADINLNILGLNTSKE